jgi:hypothetical protein
MRILKIGLVILAFLALTVLTQVGGLVFLISLFTHKFINNKIRPNWGRYLLKCTSFLLLYVITTLAIIPLIAKPLGRVPMPVTQTNGLQPLNVMTCLLNRHYVRSELRQTTLEVARQMDHQFPGTIMNYLDAGFPFINKFPLIPHLSHNDGKKLDLAFCYIDNRTGLPTNQSPSIIGYGISEQPHANEVNTAAMCSSTGHWQYSFMMTIIPQGNRRFFTFDSIRTKALVNRFAAAPAIGKIFIEPHLKARLGITSNKIRFHGCQAVRHDDHIHVQLK